jgi:hypothetical protein
MFLLKLFIKIINFEQNNYLQIYQEFSNLLLFINRYIKYLIFH